MYKPNYTKKVHGPFSVNKTQITILACANAVSLDSYLHYEWTRGGVPNTV